MGIIFAILIFSFIVFFHELGHFSLAKKNGIDVEEFSLGMGPTLLAKDYKGTRYCIKLLPIGGSCMMGEDEEVSDSPTNFNNKSVWQRISVIVAGPIFNFILAFVFAVILTVMVGYDKPIAAGITSGSAAEAAGLKTGDEIVRINKKKINIFREIQYYNQFHQGEKAEVTYLRDGEKRTVSITPKIDAETGLYMFGIERGANGKANIGTALQYGIYEVKFWIATTLESLKMLVTGQISFNNLSGPVGIVDVVDNTYQESKSYGVEVVIAQMMNIAILLSANLGVMNLLPLPALDGGRLIFLGIEAVRKKRVAPEREGYVHFVGIVLLMALMVFVMFNDVRKIFF